VSGLRVFVWVYFWRGWMGGSLEWMERKVRFASASVVVRWNGYGALEGTCPKGITSSLIMVYVTACTGQDRHIFEEE
jgi:hypothetical protein